MNAHKMKATSILMVIVANLSMLGMAEADDVKIVAADFVSRGNNQWSVSVTLKHADAGWDHYADNWRVTDGDGNVLGDRVLHHPHVEEQPFARSLGGVKVPEGVTTLYIEAHDKVHGWTPNRLQIDLGRERGEKFRVEAD